MILIAKDIKKGFSTGFGKRKEVLKGVNFSLEESQMLCIMGPSGGGKSTLLKILAGILRHDSGDIYYQDKKIYYHEMRYISDISFIFQDYKLIPHLNAFENVALALRLRSIPDFEQKAKEAMEYVGVSHLMNVYPPQMSGGENQRVGIARSLSINPRIIFADEPTGNLDRKTGKEILSVFERIKKERKTSFVIVSHDVFLRNVSDVAVYMKDGLLVEEDPYGYE